MTKPVPKLSQWVLTKRLLAENARQYWRGYAAGFALLLISSAMTALFAYVIEDVINDVFVDPTSGRVGAVALFVVVIFFVRALATYGSGVILARIGNRIVAKLQSAMFRQMQAQSIGWIDKQELGNLTVRFQSGVSAARRCINMLVTSVGRDVLTLVSLTVVMVIQDPLMSFLALVVAPPAIGLILLIMRRITKIARREFDIAGRVMNLLKEAYLGARVVKSFQLEARSIDEMQRTVESVRKLNDKMARLSNITSPAMDMLGGFVLAGIIIYGGWRIGAGELDAGSLFSFLTAFLLAYEPAKRLGQFNVNYQKLMVGVERLYEVLDAQPDATERTEGTTLDLGEGAIRLEDVRLTLGETEVLRGLDLEVPPRRVVALVGPSGAGKTTVLSLINRLRNPSAGRVLIDGQDIAPLSVSELRRHIAVIGQEPFLFDTTIAENIRMGRQDATDEEVEAAARAANAHEFIMEQERGYDTPVGEGGGRLSGGQRQRVAIARAMLTDAPILLMDEATSALDNVSERKVMEAVGRLMAGRTVVIIAHRLSTIRHADLVHVISEGRLAESGTHDELLSRDGLYRHLHDTQLTAVEA